MNDIQKKYESEIGEKALYRTDNGVDHHTLKYVRWLEAALAEKEAELRRLKGHTWCAYCGQEYLLDTVTADQIGEHIRTCLKHPMRATERHLESVEEQNGQLKQELAELLSHVRLLVAAHDAKLSCEVESLIEELRIGGKFPSIHTVGSINNEDIK